MILSVNGQDLSAPKTTQGDSIYCFARVLSLENRGLMDGAAVACLTEQLLFTAVCWGLTKIKEKELAKTHWKLPKR